MPKQFRRRGDTMWSGCRIEGLERRRLLFAGALDGNFGVNGIAQLAGFDLIVAALQPAGGVVVLVQDRSTNAPALTRFDSSGNFDGNFGLDPALSGLATGGFQAGDAFNSVGVQSDGRIVLAGTAADRTLIALRYLPDGTLDRTFGTGGLARVAGGTPGTFNATTLLVRTDDRLIVGGDVSGAGSTNLVLAALTKDGAADTTFGSGDGLALADISGAGAAAGAFALRGNDGGVVASAASGLAQGTPQVVLVRFTPTGDPDTLFNGTGRAATNALPVEASRHLAVSPDDRVVLFSPATSAAQETVARFDPAGAPDATFGANGVVRLTVPKLLAGGVPVGGGGVGIDATGRVVVSFAASNGGKGGTDVVRLNADGSVDSTFGTNGVQAYTAAGSAPLELMFGPDKTIQLAANRTSAGTGQGAIVLSRIDGSRPPTPRVDSDLVTDTAANTLSVTVTYLGDLAVEATSIDAAGVVLGGPGGFDQSPSEARNVTTSGNDVTVTYLFAPPGATLGPEDNGGYSLRTNPLLVRDVAGNYVQPATIATFQLQIGPPALAIGALDPTFGGTGVVSRALGFNGTAGVAPQVDGKVVVAGFGGPAGGQDIGLARFNPNGTADITFAGGDGIEFLDVRGTDDVVTDVKALPDGRIVVCGTTAEVVGGQTVGSDFFVARFLEDGTPDVNFNGTGILIVDFAADATTKPSTDVARSVIVQDDTEIYVVGRSDAGGSGTDFAVVSIDDDGSIDGDFGQAGRVLVDFTGGDDGAQGIISTANGAVVAAGYASDGGQTHVALVQLDRVGALDPKFGTGGRVVTSAGGTTERANAVAAGRKGQIVIAGSSATGGAGGGTFTSDLIAARYSSRGRLDPKFAAGGIARVSFGLPANATAVQSLPDGRVVASGVLSATGGTEAMQLVVARFTAAGTPDTTFGGSGTPTPTPPGTVVLSVGSSGTNGINLRTADADARLNPAATSAVTDLDAFQNTTEGKLAGKQGGGAVDAVNNGTQTNVAALVTEGVELSATLDAKLPAAVLGGAKVTAQVGAANVGDRTASGTIDIQFFVSADTTLGSGDIQFFTVQGQPLNLKPLTLGGTVKTFKVKLTLPADVADGSYYVLAKINATQSISELNPTNDTAATFAPVAIAAAFVDLNGPALAGGNTLVSGRPATLSVSVTDGGNIPVNATVQVAVTLSTGDASQSADIALDPVAAKISLKPGGTGVVKIKVLVPAGSVPGNYFLLVRIDSANTVVERDEGNNLLASTLPSTLA